MEPGQNGSDTKTITGGEGACPLEVSPEPQPVIDQPKLKVKPEKNLKRVEAGKKLAERNKKEKEKMLADIAQANANANEANNTLKSYLEQKEASKPSVYQTPFIISGVVFLAGLYIWSSRPNLARHDPAWRAPSQHEPPPDPAWGTPHPRCGQRQAQINDDDMYKI